MLERTVEEVQRDAAEVTRSLNQLSLSLSRLADMPTDATSVEKSRDALLNVTRFVESFGISGHQTVPLWWIVTHLSDLSNGRRSDVFRPAKRNRGRPRDSKLQETRRAFTAAVMELYMEVGASQNDAAARTARMFAVKKSMVTNWRDSLIGSMPSDEPVRSQWKLFRRIVDERPKDITLTREWVDGLARELLRYLAPEISS